MNPTSAAAQRTQEPPLREIRYAPVSVAHQTRPDGTHILRSRDPLAAHESSMARLFRATVERAPASTFLAERGGGGDWRKLTYADARGNADRVAQALVDRGLSAERPVMVLSGNAIEHGVLKLACFTAGIPI